MFSFVGLLFPLASFLQRLTTVKNAPTGFALRGRPPTADSAIRVCEISCSFSFFERWLLECRVGGDNTSSPLPGHDVIASCTGALGLPAPEFSLLDVTEGE